MRKLIIGLLSVILISCGTQADKKTADSEPLKSENKAKPVLLTKAEFVAKVANYDASPDEWKYLGDKPCIVDFYADWCGPCKAIAPILEELAAEYDGQIYIYKVNTDKERELAMAFGIRSIPALLFCPMEGEPQISNGAQPKHVLKQAIDEVLLEKI